MAKESQQIPIRQRSGGGGGGGGGASLANVAIGNFINDQNTAQKKMMNNFAKLSEAQAVESSQNAAEMTNAMNQIVAREDERRSREESMQEKMKDQEHQEEYQEWRVKFKKQSDQDARDVLTRIAAQNKAGRNLIERLDTDRIEFSDRIKDDRMKLSDPARVARWNRLPKGKERLREMTRQLRLAEIFREQNQHGRLTAQVEELMAKGEEQINAGEEHFDLSQLAKMDSKELLASVSMSDEEMEELWHYGGSPPGGLYGRDPDDPTLEKYKGFNPIHYMTQSEFQKDEDYFALVQDDDSRKDYVAMRLESRKDLLEEHNKAFEFSTRDYDRLAQTAVDSTYYGIAGFIDELGSGRLSPLNLSKSLVLKSGGFESQDILDNLAGGVLESVFLSIGGPGSEAILNGVESILSSEGPYGTWDTPLELNKAFVTRNILRHLNDQLMGMTEVSSGGRNPLALKLSKQIVDMKGSPEGDAMIEILTLVPGDVQRGERLEGLKTGRITGNLTVEGEIQVYEGVLRMFNKVLQKTEHIRNVVEAQPIMQTYQMNGGSLGQQIDGLVGSYESHDETELPFDIRAKAVGAGTKQGYMKVLAGEEDDEGINLEAETLKRAVRLSPFQAFSKLIGPITYGPEYYAVLYSKDYDLAPVNIPPVGEDNIEEVRLGLKNYKGTTKIQREKMEALRKQMREAKSKETSSPGENAGGSGSLSSDEQSAPMVGAGG